MICCYYCRKGIQVRFFLVLIHREIFVYLHENVVKRLIRAIEIPRLKMERKEERDLKGK